MIPAIVTDELSGDPVTAFELGREWGVSHFELRGVFDARVPRLLPHLRRRLVQAVREFGVTVTALSPGLFKCPFPGDAPASSNLGWMDRGYFETWDNLRSTVDDHLRRLLPESIELALEVGARSLIAFGFSRGGMPAGPAPSGTIEALAEAAEVAGKAGLSLLVETEEGFWADTGARSAALIERIGNPSLGINWDPANALIEGDVPFPDGYGAVRPHIRNVHFKDARRYPNGSWELLAEGDVDWWGQVAALHADNYSGPIAVEPHLAPSVASTRAALDRLRSLIEAAKARGGQGEKSFNQTVENISRKG
jgi:sugar phosphate isomerase/epimerase